MPAAIKLRDQAERGSSANEETLTGSIQIVENFREGSSLERRHTTADGVVSTLDGRRDSLESAMLSNKITTPRDIQINRQISQQHLAQPHFAKP